MIGVGSIQIGISKMSTSDQLTVLYWQSAATMFLAIDYFLPRLVIVCFNKMLSSYFKGMKQRVGYDIFIAVKKFKKRIPEMIKSFMFIIIGAFLVYAGIITERHSEIACIPFFILGLIFFVSGFYAIIEIFLEFFSLIGMSAPFIMLSMAVIHSPKGPLGAIGVGCFIVSLALQFSFLSA